MRHAVLILAATLFASSHAGAVFEISPAMLSKLFLTSGSGLLVSVSPDGKVDDQFAAIATRLRELSSLHVLRLAVVNCASDRARCIRFGLEGAATAPAPGLYFCCAARGHFLIGWGTHLRIVWARESPAPL